MSEESDLGAERRAFLKAAGKFAVTVPPAMTFLLTTSLQSEAIANSNGQPITSNSAAIDSGDSATTTTYSTSTANSPRQRPRGVNKY